MSDFTVSCEHCGKQIKCTDDFGVQEHCDYCKLSIFASAEDIINEFLNPNK